MMRFTKASSKRGLPRTWLATLTVVFSLAVAGPALAGPAAADSAATEQAEAVQAADRAEGREALLERIARDGEARVLVRVRVSDLQGLQALSAASTRTLVSRQGQGAQDPDARLAAAISAASAGVISTLDGTAHRVLHTFRTVPYVLLSVRQEALQKLESMPEVLAIQEDRLSRPDPLPKPAALDAPDAPLLDQSTAVIGAPQAWARGYAGQGTSVAVLDTGVLNTHEFLAGKVVSEACYSTTGGSAFSVCPGGGSEETGPNTARPPDASVYGFFHGTHVAGIAAGYRAGGTPGAGVARGASLIGVQVFSRFNDAGTCGAAPAPCLLSYTSDQIKGLERVYALRNDFTIASVNMSLGGGQFSSICEGEAEMGVITQLRRAGIATAISSGNNGFCDSIGGPACIPTSVSVGATDNLDVETSFSNWGNALVSFFAPGYQVNSSVPPTDSGYQVLSGTSMAAPHVAGALAILRQRGGAGARVSLLDGALLATGVAPDVRCDLESAPRIQVNDALDALSAITAPPSALHDNGPFQTGTGTGIGGFDESLLQGSSLGMTTYGFGVNTAAGNRLADDFTVPAGQTWTLEALDFFAYQSFSRTTSPIVSVNYRIWSGSPADPGSTVLYGDTTTNRLRYTCWTDVIRVQETATGTTAGRPIMLVRAVADVKLGPGTYWLDWQFGGSSALTGPWGPPITTIGQTTTGDALQYTTTSGWAAAVDTGILTPQGMPFVVRGSLPRQGTFDVIRNPDSGKGAVIYLE